MIRPSAATSYRSGVRVDGCSREASDEQPCQGTLGIARAIGWYAFAAALLNKCDSLRTRILGVFSFGELYRELVKRSL